MIIAPPFGLMVPAIHHYFPSSMLTSSFASLIELTFLAKSVKSKTLLCLLTSKIPELTAKYFLLPLCVIVNGPQHSEATNGAWSPKIPNEPNMHGAFSDSTESLNTSPCVVIIDKW